MTARAAGLAALLALLALGGVAAAHPGLRFVDLVSFSARAQDVALGHAARDALYPLGYPALLAAGHTIVGDVLVFAKVVSVLATSALVALVAGRLGLVAGLWILVQVPVLQWGTTEGTDMLAASLSIVAIVVSRHGLTAGLCMGLALSTRWTSAAWVLPLFLAAADRRRVAVGLAAGLLAHLVPAWITGSAPWPDQGLNAAIAGGGSVWSRVAAGVPGVPRALLPDVFAVVGGLSLVAASALSPARDGPPVARALLLGGVLHGLGLAAMFANPRLALPATLAAYVGLPLLLSKLGERGVTWSRGGTALLTVATVSALGWGQRQPLQAGADEARAAKLVAVLAQAPPGLDGAPLLSNSPWAHHEASGWRVPAVQLSSLGPPHTLTPAGVAAAFPGSWCLLDSARGRGFPGLSPMMRGDDVVGWTLVRREGGVLLWRSR